MSVLDHEEDVGVPRRSSPGPRGQIAQRHETPEQHGRGSLNKRGYQGAIPLGGDAVLRSRSGGFNRGRSRVLSEHQFRKASAKKAR